MEVKRGREVNQKIKTLCRGICSSNANDYSSMSTISIRTSIQIGIEFPGQ